jgi:ferredoxin
VVWLSVVIDNACTRILEAWGTGAQLTSMRVNPAVYDAVAAARPGETARAYPLMLLGLRVFALGEDGLARVQQDGRVLPPGPGHPAEVSDGYAARVREASRACPGDCIQFETAAGPLSGDRRS